MFIGTDLDEEAVTTRLDDCLLDDEAFAEFDPESWTTDEENPFPAEQGEQVVLTSPDVS